MYYGAASLVFVGGLAYGAYLMHETKANLDEIADHLTQIQRNLEPLDEISVGIDELLRIEGLSLEQRPVHSNK